MLNFYSKNCSTKSRKFSLVKSRNLTIFYLVCSMVLFYFTSISCQRYQILNVKILWKHFGEKRGNFKLLYKLSTFKLFYYISHELTKNRSTIQLLLFFCRNIDKYSDKNWGQHKPKFDSQSLSGSSTGQSGPPILPPQLLNILLNKEASLTDRTDPVLLPEPSSHVMLNHLYAQSIRDNLLVMASTTRYKKKCVTIIYYCPLDM